jgi:hypothetical protein
MFVHLADAFDNSVGTLPPTVLLLLPHSGYADANPPYDLLPVILLEEERQWQAAAELGPCAAR